MKAIRLIIISFLIMSVLSSCAISQNNKTDGPQADTNKNKIVEDDFNITYKGILINDKIPFKEIADKLGITIGKNEGNTDIKAGTTVEGISYSWYVVHYPSKEKEDIRIEYVVNETYDTLTLVYIDLFSAEAKTYRGITVGDDLKKLVEAYGNDNKPLYNTANTVYYEYKLENKQVEKYLDKEISIVVDNNSEKITEISINYNQNKMMEELDIIAFD